MLYWMQRIGAGVVFICAVFLIYYWLNGGLVMPMVKVIENQQRIARSLEIICEIERDQGPVRCEELEEYNRRVLRGGRD